jgi:uncharacterized protein (TIGR00304 family)
MDPFVRLVRFAGPALFLAGVTFLAVGFLHNEATLSLFVIFPVITATGGWSMAGILLMIAGFFVFFMTWFAPAESQPVSSDRVPVSPAAGGSPPSPTSPRRWGGVVFLGPVPVVFGSDPKLTRWMLVLGALLFVALLVLTIISLRGI